MKYIIEFKDKNETGYIVVKGNRFHLDYNAKKFDAYRFTSRDNALTYYNCMFAGMDYNRYMDMLPKLNLIALDE